MTEKDRVSRRLDSIDPYDGWLERHLPRVRRPSVAALCFIAALLAVSPALLPSPFQSVDMIFQWYAGYLVWTGRSPYDLDLWRAAVVMFQSGSIYGVLAGAIHPWPYPPWTAYAFVPFAMVGYPAGAWLQYGAYVCAGYGAAIAIVRSIAWRSTFGVAFATASVATFQPLVISAQAGQFSGFLLGGVALLALGLRGGSTVALVAGALLVSLKPHVALVIAVVVVALLVESRRARDLLALAVTLAACAGVAVLRHPESVAVMMSGVGERLEGFRMFESSWALARSLFPEVWPAVGVALAVLVGLLSAVAVRRSPSNLRSLTALAGGASCSLAVTPNVFSYDHVLLVPAMLLTIVMGDSAPTPARLALLLGVLVVFDAAPWLAYSVDVATPLTAASALIPVGAAALLASAMLLRSDSPLPQVAGARSNGVRAPGVR